MYSHNRNYNNNRNDSKKEWHKNNNKQNDYPKNLKVDVPVSCYGITIDGKEYDGTSFIDLMEDLQDNNTFSKISIPVYMKASYTNNNPDAKWNTVVGYLKDFSSDTGNATCVIFNKSTKYFEKIADPTIVPRVVIKQGKCTCIIGLDIVDQSDIRN